MEIPGIRGKKIEESQKAESGQNAPAASSSSAGIASEQDSIEKAEGETYFFYSSINHQNGDYRAGIGLNEEKQSLIVGAEGASISYLTWNFPS